MTDPKMLALIVVAVLIVLWTVNALIGPGSRAQFARRGVMTPNELEFFWRLRTALPEFIVCPQVAMSAVLTHSPRVAHRNRFATRNRFDRKVVDFVILDAAGLTVALVELDDATHSKDLDAARDAMTGMVGYRTVRFNSRPRPTTAAIRAAVVQ